MQGAGTWYTYNRPGGTRSMLAVPEGYGQDVKSAQAAAVVVLAWWTVRSQGGVSRSRGVAVAGLLMCAPHGMVDQHVCLRQADFLALAELWIKSVQCKA
jgi:hypothetical protein